MATRVISTSIKLDGEAEFKKQLSSVNSNLKNLNSDMRLVTEEFKGQANSLDALTAKDKILNEQVAQQKEKIQALEQAITEATDAYGENDKRVDDYRRSLNNAKADLIKLERELDQNNGYLDEAKKSADGAAKSIDGFGKEVKDATKDSKNLGSFFGGVGGNLGDLKKLVAGGAVAAGIQAVGSAIMDVVESTEEYRKIMGTLELSSQSAGYDAEETAEAYDRLYGVLGDTQATATTIANLQAIGLGQTDLMAVLDAAVGAWATYGDSIPIDGLAESINETIQAGQVTGTFADVLNWAGTNEDEFNEKLAAANSSAERANIVMEQLARQGLVDAGQSWRDLNPDITAANDAQNEWNKATGRLGEILAPVAANLKLFGADSVNFLVDTMETLPGALKGLIEDFGGLGENLVEGFINGIKKVWDGAVWTTKTLVNDIKDAFTGPDGLDEHSPSRWAKTVGEYMMDGLAIGMENGKGEVMETAEDIVDEVKARFDALTDGLEDLKDISDLQYDIWELTYGKNASESEKYDAKLKILNQQEAAQVGIVQAAQAAYEEVAEQYGETSVESYEYQKTLLEEEKKYYQLLDAINEVLRAKAALADADSAAAGSVLSSLSGGAPSTRSAASSKDVYGAVAAGVSSINQTAGSETPIYVQSVLEIDGREFARTTQAYYREADKSNPEVVSDKL